MGNKQSEFDFWRIGKLSHSKSDRTKETKGTEKQLEAEFKEWLQRETEARLKIEKDVREERERFDENLRNMQEKNEKERKEREQEYAQEQEIRHEEEQIGHEKRRSQLKEPEEAHRLQEKQVRQQIKDFQKELQTLKPGDSFEFPPDDITFPNKYNIGLFGTTGAGKSSLLNSLKFAYKGKIDELSREQTATDQFYGGNTIRRLEVQLTRHLVFVDNRGVSVEDLEYMNAGDEIINQLEGRASFTKQVDWRSPNGGKGRKVKTDKRIYCTILVFDARNPRAIYMILPKLVDELFQWQGRYPIGVLTHVDTATSEQIENMYVVTAAAGIVDTYEVANITNTRSELQLDHQLALLKLMRLCIKQGDSIFKLREEIENEEAEMRAMEEESARKVTDNEEAKVDYRKP